MRRTVPPALAVIASAVVVAAAATGVAPAATAPMSGYLVMLSPTWAFSYLAAVMIISLITFQRTRHAAPA